MNPAEAYILKQPEPFKSILLHLQVIVETTVPGVELLYKWRVPFYYVEKSPICYLNVTKGYVDVGFWGAQYFTKHIEKLESDKRKYVKSLRYRTPDEIDDQVLIEILEQAYTFRNEKFITD
ncbi:DUF1801 domain-containing protein [Aquimarina sp. MMG016]|uniref:DUF1801 domain-containing protein n=1 Tax=Aquimarina sp. MMG016 TaxID=2822690 RepID=UPI001B39E5B0|nr:DUF1801 domain-containing protein [Aquimarina sp. MMG016]MBQ4822203.1 DUF1801 domain-containing protein [Aquimarina sp. MMG016]